MGACSGYVDEAECIRSEVYADDELLLTFGGSYIMIFQ